MKKIIPLVALGAVCGLFAAAERAQAQGTAFTYQGQLTLNGGPANGNFDFKFDSWNAASGGGVIGQPVTNTMVAVSNGLFITVIDFGAGGFTGATNWLRIQVRTNGGGAFNALSPRQELTPTPYAIYAETANAAGLSGTIPAGNLNLSGVSGSGLTSLNASQLVTGTVADALLAPDVALTDANQTFTGANIFTTGTNAGRLTVWGNTGLDTSLFTGLGLQYATGSHEGSIMSSFNDGYASLGFYTKQGNGYPIARQVKIDRYGGVAIDQQGVNNGVLNDGTTNGVGLTFGTGSGEGIASQRTAGLNQFGLDFYTSFHHRMSILQNGNVGIGMTNPGTALEVNGTVTASGLQVNGPFGATSLALPVPATVTANGNSLLYADNSHNFFAGLNAGNPVGSGPYNTANGFDALDGNLGAANTADGVYALWKNLTGNNNTAVGADALAYNTNGILNTAVGAGGLEANTSGSNNVALGAYALGNSTTDSGLVAVGYQALQNDAAAGLFTIGGANTAIGYQSLMADNSGAANTGVGYWSLYANNTGANNTALGVWALANNTGGSGNIAIGNLAGLANSAGANNNIDLGNKGNSGDSGVVRIGTQGTQTSTYLSGNVAFDGGLNLDQTGTYGANSGSVSSSALTFGTGPSGSGEGIASQRTAGPNQFDLTLYTGFKPRLTILSGGYVGVGTTNPTAPLEVNGNVYVDNTLSTAALTIRGGADLAEPFNLSAGGGAAAPGAVVVIDEQNPGRLKLSDGPYDTRVAGVVSGANGIHSGIQMQQEGALEGGKNVALTGRVYVRADASNGAIRPGDLLTTSTTPGHAMKATDHARAAGAILGKAMTGLSEGQGMVLVLVTLQ